MKYIAIICCAVLVLGVTGCTNEENENNYLTKGNDNIWVHVDEETGVNYMVFAGYNKGGICPRYNADGSLYVGGAE